MIFFFFEADPTLTIDVGAACFGCSEKKENWACLKCYTVGCSRFRKSHGLDHFRTSGHCLAFSFSDFSFWCYSCESYFKSPNVRRVYEMAYANKFGVLPASPAPSNPQMNEEELKEYEDTPEKLSASVKQLAMLIKNSNAVVAYTGAGISTSAKIPDYRGPQGVWTLKERGLSSKMDITLEQALPTNAHMALVQLKKAGFLKFLVSTNVDGLHRRSGFGKDEMSELHGNCYIENCEKCKKEYLRTHDVAKGGANHITGNKCETCGDYLKDSIIHFGENLPEAEIHKTDQWAQKQDLSLVLGTSMRVSPACKFPLSTKNLVIVNLQKTPYDNQASLRIYAKTDVVLEMLMKELNLSIEDYDPASDPIKGNNQNGK